MNLIALAASGFFLFSVLCAPNGVEGNDFEEGRRKGIVDTFEFKENGSVRIIPFAGDGEDEDATVYECLLKKGYGRGNPQSCNVGSVDIYIVQEDTPGGEDDGQGGGGDDGEDDGDDEEISNGGGGRRRHAAIISDVERGLVYQILLNGTVIERLTSDFPDEDEAPEEPKESKQKGKQKHKQEEEEAEENVENEETPKKKKKKPKNITRRLSPENEEAKDTLSSSYKRSNLRNIDNIHHNDHHRELQSLTQVDILVMWTTQAEQEAGSEAQIRADVDMGVYTFNHAAENSGVLVRLRLVDAVRDTSGYTEAKSVTDCLYDLQDTKDGNMDQVHTLRTELGADMVALITRTTCGVAFTDYTKSSLMFSVTGRTCIGGLTFAHEIAHNFGSLHDKGTEKECGSKASNYAYRDSGGTFRTVLSYNCRTDQCDNNPSNDCPRVPYFSNPDTAYTYQGKAIGSPAGTDLGETNSVKRINDSRFVMANHYPTEVGVCTTDAQCDDSLECTTETCVDGICVYTPDHASCDDNLFCNGEEKCNLNTGCESGYNAPICCGECKEGSSSHVCTGGVCGSLDTTMQGGKVSGGNMFDIFGNEDVEITGFDIHCRLTTSVTANIYIKEGTYEGFENNPNAWTEVTPTNGLTVTCQGSGQKTSLPPLPSPVLIEEGKTQAFYLGLTTSDLVYTDGKKAGDAFTSDTIIELREGVGKGVQFGSTFSPRVLNGAIRYSIPEDETPSPTITTIPSAAPSLSPSAPPSKSALPSILPSKSPSAGPSSSPSAAPTPVCTLPTASDWFIITTDNCTDERTFGTNEEITFIYHNDEFVIDNIGKIEVQFIVNGNKNRKTKFKLGSEDLGNDDPSLPQVFPDKTIRLTILMSDIGKNGGWDGDVITNKLSQSTVADDSIFYKFKVEADSKLEKTNSDLKASQAITLAPTPDTDAPSAGPTISLSPSRLPSKNPTGEPSKSPTSSPTDSPTKSPSGSPTASMVPTTRPTESPTNAPNSSPTQIPTTSPSNLPTAAPVPPTAPPTASPTSSCQLPQTSSWLVVGRNGGAPCSESLEVESTDEVTFVFYDENIDSSSEIKKIEVEFLVMGDKNRKTKWKIEKVNFFTVPSVPRPYAVKDGNVVRFFLTIPVNKIGDVNKPAEAGEWMNWKFKVKAKDTYELSGSGTTDGIQVY